MSAAAKKRTAQDDEDQHAIFPTDWRTFGGVLKAKGDASIPRLSYLDGWMEVLVPGKSHASVAEPIGRLIEIWADETGIVIEGTGSWTLKKELKQAGAEPDKSWVVGDRPSARLPDLALEVLQTHGGLDKLTVYARLGVRRSGSGLKERSASTCCAGRATCGRQEARSFGHAISHCWPASRGPPRRDGLRCYFARRCGRSLDLAARADFRASRRSRTGTRRRPSSPVRSAGSCRRRSASAWPSRSRTH